MRRIAISILSAIGCVAALPARAQTNAAVLTETLSLEQAYDRALATDQSIRIAFEEIRKARLQPWSALTRLGLRATASGNYNQPQRDILSTNGGVRTPLLVDTRSASLTLQQPLIDFTVFPAFKLGRLSERSSELAHRFTVRGILFGVAQAYYEVLKQQQVVLVDRETLELANQQLTLADNRFKVGDVTKTDVLRARLTMEQAREALIQAENALRLDRNILSNILNFGTERNFVVADPPPYPTSVPSLGDVERTARERREDLGVSRLAIDRSVQSRNEVLGQYGPQIVAQWSQEWIDPPTQTSPNNFWNANFAVSIPIFEGGQREIDLRTAGYAINEAKLQYENVSKSVEVEVKTAWLQVHTLEQTLKAVQAEVDAAAENYKSLQNQYKAGTVTSLDAQQALRDLSSARTDLAVQTYDYQVALRDLERVTGLFQQPRVNQVKSR